MMRAAKVCLRTTKEGGLLVNLFIPSVHTHAHRHMHIHTQTHMQTQTPTHLPTQKGKGPLYESRGSHTIYSRETSRETVQDDFKGNLAVEEIQKPGDVRSVHGEKQINCASTHISESCFN